MKASEAFEVRYTQGARDDLLRLFDSLLERARIAQDLDVGHAAVEAIRTAVEAQLTRAPFIYRKVGEDPFLRELAIPFGSVGYVALYHIATRRYVDVLAIRHQRED